MDQSAERVPPTSLESEMAVLGSIMIERSTLDVVREIVRPKDFYAVVHETLYRAILDLADRSQPTDIITIAQYLQDRGKLDQCGGFPYINSCMETTPTSASAEFYASIVRDKATLRGLIEAGGKITRIGFEEQSDVKAAVAAAESVFASAVDVQPERATDNTIFSHLKDNYLKIMEVRSGEAPMEAQILPWPSVSKHSGPIMPGEFVLWPAPPKVGKTGILQMIADYNSLNYGTVVFFSGEMSTRAITMRYVAMYSGVSARKQREGILTGEELQAISDASMLFEAKPIHLFDRNAVSSIADMRSKLRSISLQAPIKSVVIDGVNLLDDVDAKKGDRSSAHDRLDVMYKGFVKMAIDYHCSVHAAQHVSRSGMRENTRPTMADIRGGGNPEGHANIIISPFRENPMGTEDEQEQGDFTVLASRDGNTAQIGGMRFVGHRALWLDPQHGGRAWWGGNAIPIPSEEQRKYENDIYAGAY